MPSQAELCLSVARYAHEGQVDKAGKPYIEHPMRVASNCETETQRCAALLHDVIEDTELDADDLLALGVSHRVVQVVRALTHNARTDYLDYIRDLASDSDARVVKIADLRDNMDLSRLDRVTEADLRRQRKYESALHILLDGVNDPADGSYSALMC